MTLRQTLAAALVRGLYGRGRLHADNRRSGHAHENGHSGDQPAKHRHGARAANDPDAQRWLTPVIAAALPGIALVLAGSLVAALVGLVPPWLTKQLIDKGLMASNWAALWHYAGLTLVVGLLLMAGSVANSLTHLHFSARMLADLRARMFDASLNRRVGTPPLPVGEAMARIDGDTAQIQQFSFDTTLAAASSVFRLVGGAVMLFILDWRLALIPLVAAPVNLAFLTWARPRTRARAGVVRDSRGALASYLAESFAGLPGLRALAAQDARAEGLAPLQSRQIAALMAQRRWSELTAAIPQLTGALVRVAILLGGGALVIRGDWQVGSLVAFLAYVGMMTGPLQNLLGLYHAQAQAMVALDRLAAIADPDGDERGGRPPAPGPGALRFVAGRGQAGTHAPIEAVIRPGALVLIDGPSGVGKSSLAGLAAGLTPPARGARVFLDGEDVAGLDPRALRRAVALVPQAPMLFAGTVADNLRLAAPDASATTMTQALADAGLPVALDAPVAEAGRNLSGGERQRLSLARALMLPFRVLILDESLSEVDAPATSAILSRIRTRHPERTLLVIAHAGPARGLPFDQVLTLTPDPAFLSARGDMPNQRENARENAV